ncbi:C45 family autoproteolytic acyltransferase/hydrolase, partial [Thermodesulfobacteriota bacterium]
MRRLAFGFLFSFLFTLPLPVGLHAEVLGVCETGTGIGWLERSEFGDLILHLDGSYYDMGFQHGSLLAEEGRHSIRAIRAMIRKARPLIPMLVIEWYLHRFVYSRQAPHIPTEFKEELRGGAEATGVPLKRIEALHALTYLTSCATSSAWGPATATGALHFLRSNDTFFSVDPETSTMIQAYGMIVLYRPDEGVPYMMISWPGYTGASDGMNAEGIAVANMSNPSRYESPAGLPMSFRLKNTLSKARTLDDAVALMTAEPLGGGYNFLVADAKIPDARAIEMDAKTVYVGGWDGPAESSQHTYKGRDYAYTPQEGLLTRTNHPLSSELIANHKGKIEAGDVDDCRTARRYRDLRVRLLAGYGALDAEGMNAVMRAHYRAMYQGEGDDCYPSSTHQMILSP